MSDKNKKKKNKKKNNTNKNVKLKKISVEEFNKCIKKGETKIITYPPPAEEDYFKDGLGISDAEFAIGLIEHTLDGTLEEFLDELIINDHIRRNNITEPGLFMLTKI